MDTATAYAVVDLGGTFAFAVSGALLAVRKDYDIVGIAVLACATAFGGGVIRDLIIADRPPAAFTNVRYIGVSLLAAAIIFCWHPPRQVIRGPLNVADAFGLGLFCVTGTVKAHEHGLGAVSAAVLGVVTAAGGGVLRDLLAGQTPAVLRYDQELYALPALVGAGLTAALLRLGVYTQLAGALAAVCAVALRLLALRYHWHAPRARVRKREP